MESFSVPALSTLKSTDAVAIREITFSLINEITKLRKELQDMKNMQDKSQRKNVNR
jgi:hypothetical protein